MKKYTEEEKLRELKSKKWIEAWKDYSFPIYYNMCRKIIIDLIKQLK